MTISRPVSISHFVAKCNFSLHPRAVLSDSKFFEGNLVNFDQPPPDEEVDEYDYESDSDLGYFSEDEEKFDEDDWRKVDPVSDDIEQDLCGTDDGNDVGLYMQSILTTALDVAYCSVYGTPSECRVGLTNR